jgi:hypothetical protein
MRSPGESDRTSGPLAKLQERSGRCEIGCGRISETVDGREDEAETGQGSSLGIDVEGITKVSLEDIIL